MSTDDLLRPVLNESDRPPVGVYSLQAMFLSAFLLGPFAAIALTGINSYRLERLRREWPWLVAAAIATIALIAFLPVESLAGRSSLTPMSKILVRAGALLLVGLGYLMHQKNYRAMSLIGVKAAKPDLAMGIGLLAGLAALVAVVIVVRT